MLGFDATDFVNVEVIAQSMIWTTYFHKNDSLVIATILHKTMNGIIVILGMSIKLIQLMRSK